MLYNADICVVPGDIGLTAIHSLTFGVPVITHDCFKYQGPEFEAVKEGVTGSFYEYSSVDSLAKHVRLWFESHRLDREAVRQACYHEIDNYWTPEFQLSVLKDYLL